MVKRGLQKRGLELIFGGTEQHEVKEEKISEPKKQIVLYLRDGLNPADRNFTKYPNEIHEVMRGNLEEEAEGILYVYLWWQSWGFGSNYCRTSYSIVARDTVIGSKKTARRAMAGLVERQFVVKALSEDGDRNVTQEGGLYRILTPREIQNRITDEGVPFDEISRDGVVMLTMPNMTTLERVSSTGDQNGVVKMTMPNMTSGQDDHAQYDHSGVVNMAVVNMTTQPLNTDKIRANAKHGQNDHAQNDHPLKDRLTLKDTLSPRAIVSGFYKGIGQSKISKTKRERAEKSLKELTKDGFSLDDIHFAVEWTLKSSKEEPYDFSIIKHTIGQAMAAKKKTEAEKAKWIEAERIAAQERAEEELREREAAKIEAYKEGLADDERAKLRERAEAEIRDSGQFKEEFITDYLIEVKENELIRDQIGEKMSE